MASHPERTGDVGLEPGVGELLALREAWAQLDRMGEQDLREISKQMARLVIVVHPSALRWLAAEAARNLSQGFVPTKSTPAVGEVDGGTVTVGDGERGL